MSRPQRKGCDAGHVQRVVWAKVGAACLTKVLNARLRPEEKLILPRGQMPVMTGLLVGFTSLKSPRDNQTSTIDIFDDLKQGGNRRAPRTVARSSKQDSDPDQVID
jgi:hypothetical protein